MKFSFKNEGGENNLNRFKFNRFNKIKTEKELEDSETILGSALSVGRKQYNPEKMDYPLGEIIKKGKDVRGVDKNDTRFRLYRKETKKAETEEDFLKLGFNKYKTQPNSCFAFVNDFGDKVVFNSDGEKIYSSF